MSTITAPNTKPDFRAHPNSFITSSQIVKSFQYVNHVVTCYDVRRFVHAANLYCIMSVTLGKVLRPFAQDLLDLADPAADHPNADLNQYVRWRDAGRGAHVKGGVTIEDRDLRELYEYTMSLNTILESIIERYIDDVIAGGASTQEGPEAASTENAYVATAAAFAAAKSLRIVFVFPEIQKDGAWRACFAFTRSATLSRNERRVTNYVEELCRVIFAKKMGHRTSRIYAKIHYNPAHYNMEYMESAEYKDIVARME